MESTHKCDVMQNSGKVATMAMLPSAVSTICSLMSSQIVPDSDSASDTRMIRNSLLGLWHSDAEIGSKNTNMVHLISFERGYSQLMAILFRKQTFFILFPSFHNPGSCSCVISCTFSSLTKNWILKILHIFCIFRILRIYQSYITYWHIYSSLISSSPLNGWMEDILQTGLHWPMVNIIVQKNPVKNSEGQ